MRATRGSDLKVDRIDGLTVLRPLTAGGRQWIDEVRPRGAVLIGEALVIDASRVRAITNIAQLDGLYLEF
jgi:hypothetical protein